jgi:hypothetical protein
MCNGGKHDPFTEEVTVTEVDTTPTEQHIPE